LNATHLDFGFLACEEMCVGKLKYSAAAFRASRKVLFTLSHSYDPCHNYIDISRDHGDWWHMPNVSLYDIWERRLKRTMKSRSKLPISEQV
jgi:hypothetical protein